MRCAYCHEDASPADALAACQGCATQLHAACWTTVGRCPTLGCTGEPPRRGGLLAWIGRKLSELSVGLIDWQYGVGTVSATDLAEAALGHVQAGALEAALIAADKALALDARASVACLARGLTYLELEDCGRAASDCERALELDPVLRSFAAFSLVHALRACWDEAGAEGAHATGVKSLCRGQPRDLFAASCLVLWDSGAALADAPRPSLASAKALRMRGDLVAAASDLLAAIEADAQGARPEHSLVLLLQGRLDEALQEVEGWGKFLAGSKGSWPHLARAAVQHIAADGPGPLEALLEARAIRPSCLDAAGWLAALGDTGAAPPIVKNPHPWSSQLLSGACGFLAPLALLDCARAVEGRRFRAEALQEGHFVLGLIADRDGDRARAIEHLEAVVSFGDTLQLEYVWAFGLLRRWGRAPVHAPPRPAE